MGLVFETTACVGQKPRRLRSCISLRNSSAVYSIRTPCAFRNPSSSYRERPRRFWGGASDSPLPAVQDRSAARKGGGRAEALVPRLRGLYLEAHAVLGRFDFPAVYAVDDQHILPDAEFAVA